NKPSAIIPSNMQCNRQISHTTRACIPHMNMVKNKYRSTLTNEDLHQCLCLAFTPFVPKFKPQKNVTFHTNKATSPFVHSSNVFVGVMFLGFDRHCSGHWTEWKFGEWTFWVSNRVPRLYTVVYRQWFILN